MTIGCGELLAGAGLADGSGVDMAMAEKGGLQNGPNIQF
jgi:hypothetical protein